MKSEYSRACNLSDNSSLHFNVHSTFFSFHLLWMMTSFYVKILNTAIDDVQCLVTHIFRHIFISSVQLVIFIFLRFIAVV